MVWLGSRPIFDSIIVARDALFGQDWAMCPPLQTEMKLQLSKSQRLPKRILGHCSQQQGGHEACAGTSQSAHCRLHHTFPTLDSQSDKEGNSHAGFFFPPKGNERIKQAISKQASKQAKCLK